MTIDLNQTDHEWDRCRCCGFRGPEVFERVKRLNAYDHVKEKRLDDLRLCDICACVGSICEGQHDKPVGHLDVSELANILQTVIWKVRDGAEPTCGTQLPLARD